MESATAHPGPGSAKDGSGHAAATEPAPAIGAATSEAGLDAPSASESASAATDARGAVVPTSLKRDDLLRAYYEALLDEEGGDLRRVASRAGRKARVLQAELERLGVRLHRGLPLVAARRSA
ncbi:MAG: hypothetical protein ACKOCT_18195 [Alphaproteobacteria bacterium]